MAAHHPDREDLGVRLIVLYKASKAVLQLALAAALVALAATGEITRLRDTAAVLREHVASRWSLVLARALAELVSRRGVRLLELGLVLDALVSALEGFSLWRGYAWGPWLVVVATAAPLPLELLAVAHAHRPWRIVLVVLNAAVVLYLARRIASRHSPKAAQPARNGASASTSSR